MIASTIMISIKVIPSCAAEARPARRGASDFIRLSMVRSLVRFDSRGHAEDAGLGLPHIAFGHLARGNSSRAPGWANTRPVPSRIPDPTAHSREVERRETRPLSAALPTVVGLVVRH